MGASDEVEDILTEFAVAREAILWFSRANSARCGKHWPPQHIARSQVLRQ